jgi:hypothetical protein
VAGPRRAAGFTLLETLVVIVMAAVVISLALPAFSESRITARTVRSQATSGQLLAALSMYSAEHDDTFAFFATRGDPHGPKVLLGHEMPGSYLGSQSAYYATLLVPSYFGGREAIEQEWVQEEIRERGYPKGVVRSDHRMTYSAFTSARYWRGEETPRQPAHFRPSRWAELRFPSRKGLLFDQYAGLFDPLRSRRERERRVHQEMVLGLGDGSASLRRWSDSVPFIINRSEHGGYEWPILTTKDGFSGVDF